MSACVCVATEGKRVSFDVQCCVHFRRPRASLSLPLGMLSVEQEAQVITFLVHTASEESINLTTRAQDQM